MKILLSICLFFSLAVNVDLNQARSSLVEAGLSKENADAYYELLEDYDRHDAVILAHKGASEIIKAKFALSASDKLGFAKRGKNRLEAAVKSEPQNVEIRFIRLIIQENVPGILKYKMNLNEDKLMILENFSGIDSELKTHIKQYVTNHSKIFTTEEKENIAAE